MMGAQDTYRKEIGTLCKGQESTARQTKRKLVRSMNQNQKANSAVRSFERTKLNLMTIELYVPFQQEEMGAEVRAKYHAGRN